MVTKMLTDTVRLEQQYTTAQVAIEATTSERQMTYEHWKDKGIIKIPYHDIPFLNVKRLMFYHHTIETFKLTQFLPLQERKHQIAQMMLPYEQTELYKYKKHLTVQEIKAEQKALEHTKRLDKWLEQIQERLLPKIACNLIDHTALCTLDKLLWESDPTTVTQVLQQLLEMCEQKTSRIPVIPNKEALQKLLLQAYVPMFMSFPFTLNMMALRLSALSRQVMQNKPMTLYYMGATQAKAVKTKAVLAPCETRRLETKVIASGKPVGEAIPEKFSEIWTPHLTEEEKVGLIRNIKGEDLKFMSLRYAYSMPYWIRRMVAIHMGMPENSKFALYFGIGGLPTRRSTWRYDFMKYPEARYLQYSADEHIRNLIAKIQSKRGHFLKRYGKYYRRRRV